VRTASIAYNNGITFDPAENSFLFDGVSSTTTGLYRTDAKVTRIAASRAVIPPTREGYNHTGDLSFDPFRRIPMKSTGLAITPSSSSVITGASASASAR
jgi:hypothetical protein